MKAIAKTKAQQGLEIVDRNIPQIKADEVLLKVSAAGICGSDLHINEWSSGYEWLAPYLPTVLGHEFSGIVAGGCERGDKLAIGDKVICMPIKPCMTCWYCLRGKHNLCADKKTIGLHHPGAFTEYVAVPKTNCYKMDDDLNMEVAALAEPLAIATNAVLNETITIGDTVAIMGPGTIGLLIALLSKRSGASKVLLAGLSTDQKRLKIGESLGVDITVTVDKQNLGEIVADVTHGLGADHVFEASGSRKALEGSLSLARKGGSINLVGIHSQQVEIDPNNLVRQEKRIIGSYSYSSKIWQKVKPMLSESAGELSALITHRFSVESGIHGFEVAKTPEALKVLIIP